MALFNSLFDDTFDTVYDRTRQRQNDRAQAQVQNTLSKKNVSAEQHAHKNRTSQAPARSDIYSSRGRNDRQGAYDEDNEYGSRDRRSRRSRRERTPSPSRSRSRSRSGITGKIRGNLDGTERGLASGALGAVAGGFVGHQVGKGPLATVAGVLLGGLGANAWEAREARCVLSGCYLRTPLLPIGLLQCVLTTSIL